jgi:sugar phosphate isomerase/epimerase
LRDLKFCFDAGHAHMEDGIEKSFETMRERIVTAHVHDNHGEKDEHLLPYDGTIDWEALLAALAAMPGPPDLVLELKEYPAAKPPLDQIREALEKLERNFEDHRARAAQA